LRILEHCIRAPQLPAADQLRLCQHTLEQGARIVFIARVCSAARGWGDRLALAAHMLFD